MHQSYLKIIPHWLMQSVVDPLGLPFFINHQVPDFNHQAANSNHKVCGLDHKVPDSNQQVSDFDHQVSDSKAEPLIFN